MKKLFMKNNATTKALILIILSIGSFNVDAQDQLTLKGKVTDINTKAPLPFATVSVKQKAIGTVSNEEGEFELHLTTQSADDTLFVSMLGYNSYHIKLAEIKALTNLQIRLKVKPMLLKEVVVMAKKVVPEEIVKKALKNVQMNNPTYSNMLNGFYREIHEENSRTTILVEAALDIYDNGYKKPRAEKVLLTSARSSKNYRSNAFNNTRIENWNLAAGALNNNPVKYRYRFMPTGKNFTMDSILYYNDRLIYVISFFTYIPRFPNFERKNTFYIDAENFAIHRYSFEEYAKKGKYSEIPWRLSQESTYLSKRKRISTIYEFREYKGKMFLSYFDEKAFDDICNSKDDTVEFEALGHVTLVITKIETENINTVVNETMMRDRSISAQVKEYDAEFWSNAKKIALVPLTAKQIKDLEWQMPLEEQFKSKSAHK